MHFSSLFLFFSLLGKLAERAAYFSDVFFLYFFVFFNGRLRDPVAQKLIDRSSQKFQDWKTGVRACSPYWVFFFIFQGTLPWQPIKVEKSAFFPDQSTLSCCHSKTNCNIAIPISRDSIEWISLHCIQFWWHSSRNLWVNTVNNSTFCSDTAKIGISRKISQNILGLSWPTLQVW